MNHTTAPAVELRGLVKSFGAVRAVDGLDLVVQRGEVVAFLGPNGAGKTTTIDMLLGLARPDQGTVRVLGTSPDEAIAGGRIAAVLQTGGLLRDLTVRETAELVASFVEHPRPVAEVLARAGLTGIENRVVGMCSGGEQQRLRFALALLPAPDVLLLDEPTTGMDVSGRREFWGAIRADAAEGRTVVFATHYLEEADAYADRIVLVSHGRVVADGTAAHIRSIASGRVVSAAFDEPAPADDELAALPGVELLERRGERVLLHTHASDALGRAVFATPGAHDVEITSLGLEEAFLTLTSAGAAGDETMRSTR